MKYDAGFVALKSWYQYFLSNIPETTFGAETLWNLLDAFTKLIKDVEQTILCGVT